MSPTTIDDRYEVKKPLGSGGMAEVFLAHDGVLDRDVALKVLRSQFAGDAESAERFRREATSAASLSHPNIVQVYDRGDTGDGSSYISMEYVPGGTLKERLDERGPLEPVRALAVAAQVAEALWAAHEIGMVHRDIKPQNILVTDTGHLKVADFGIARAASAATISATNAVFGTAGYISPEQALGQPATRGSDIYSLGVVLYEMLTGVVPFRADNPVAVCMKHVTEPLRPPRAIDPTIPEAVDALVAKMLAKDPADRPANVSELLDDIDNARRGVPPIMPPPRTGTPRLGVRKTAAPTSIPPAVAATQPTAGKRAVGGGSRRGSGRGSWRRRAAVLISCAALALLGATSLALSPGSREGMPLGRLQSVTGGGLDAPTAGGDGTTPPQPTASSPPASAPPTSASPGASFPGDDQYGG